MKLILSKETEKLKEYYINCGYYTNKLLEGTHYLMQKNYKTMRKHFKETSDENTSIIKYVKLLYEQMHEKWLLLSEHFNAKISKLSKESRLEILTNLKNELGISEILNDYLT